jgi:hypothetical protein
LGCGVNGTIAHSRGNDGKQPAHAGAITILARITADGTRGIGYHHSQDTSIRRASALTITAKMAAEGRYNAVCSHGNEGSATCEPKLRANPVS